MKKDHVIRKHQSDRVSLYTHPTFKLDSTLEEVEHNEMC